MSKESYIKAIRNATLKALRPVLPSKHQGISDTDLEQLVFKRPMSLRLTYQGHMLMRAHVQCWQFEHDDLFLTRHIYGLGELKYPWYLSKKLFVLYGEDDALLLNLHGRDVQDFLNYSNLFND